MAQTLIDRIEIRLKALSMSAAKASKLATGSPDFIRDLKRAKSQNPSAEHIEALARVLKTSSTWLLTGRHSPNADPVLTQLDVIGTIEAGQFRDMTLSNQDADYPKIAVVTNRSYAEARQYALRVAGDSMNELFPDGSYVICAEWGDLGEPLRNGICVHVERYISGTHLVENTLKEIKLGKNGRFLLPRSTNPVHKPIPLPEGEHESNEIKIRGRVIGAYRDF